MKEDGHHGQNFKCGHEKKPAEGRGELVVEWLMHMQTRTLTLSDRLIYDKYPSLKSSF